MADETKTPETKEEETIMLIDKKDSIVDVPKRALGTTYFKKDDDSDSDDENSLPGKDWYAKSNVMVPKDVTKLTEEETKEDKSTKKTVPVEKPATAKKGGQGTLPGQGFSDSSIRNRRVPKDIANMYRDEPKDFKKIWMDHPVNKARVPKDGRAEATPLDRSIPEEDKLVPKVMERSSDEADVVKSFDFFKPAERLMSSKLHRQKVLNFKKYESFIGSETTPTELKVFTVTAGRKKIRRNFLTRLVKDQHGIFYSKEVYLLIRANEEKKTTHIHVWLGAESTKEQEDYMIKEAKKRITAIEGEEGVTPALVRENQMLETPMFRTYFKYIMYYNGFRRTPKEKRLFMIREFKGIVPVYVQEIPPKAENLNHGDGFVYETNKKIYKWVGKRASVQERFVSATVQDKIRGRGHWGKQKVEGNDIKSWKIGKESDIRDAEDPYDVGTWYNFERGTMLFPTLLSYNFTKRNFEMVVEGSTAREKAGKKLFTTGAVHLYQEGLAVAVGIGNGIDARKREEVIDESLNYLARSNLARTVQWTVLQNTPQHAEVVKAKLKRNSGVDWIE